MNTPALNATEHIVFDAALDLIVKESFLAYGSVHAGTQHGVWRDDERAWDEDGYGRWRGPGPLRHVPKDLRAKNATVTYQGIDPVFNVASAQPVVLQWEVLTYNSETKLTFPCDFEARVWNASTGAQVFSQIVTLAQDGTMQLSVGTLPDGSYIAGCHIASVVQAPIYPSSYTLKAEYYYEEGGKNKYFDWRRNVGELPDNPANPFYALRQELVEQNAQEDRPEDADFLTSGLAREGEWSLVKLRIGAGEWACASGIVPNPGAALYKAGNAPTTPVAVAFDPLARSISASGVLTRDLVASTGVVLLPRGKVLIAGNRATQSGPNAALWAYHTNHTATLLATNTNPSTGMCECSESDHGPSDILQLRYGPRAGTIRVLTKCSKHTYFPAGDDITTRLPGTPAASDGHPGGNCLREEGQGEVSREVHFTEYFGTGDPDPRNVHVYNTLIAQEGERLVPLGGSSFHGACCAEIYRSRLWSIWLSRALRNAAGELGDAQQFIGAFDGRYREKSEIAPFDPTVEYWQRMRVCEGQLAIAGKSMSDESPKWGLLDGKYFRRFELPYRVRRLTPGTDANDTTRLYCTARKISDGAWLDARPLRVISFTPSDLHFGDDPHPMPDVTNAEDALDAMPDGTTYDVRHEETEGNVWNAVHLTDNMVREGKPIKAEAITYPNAWYRVDSDAPQDDLSTYTHRLPWGRSVALYRDAESHIDVVYLVSPAIPRITEKPSVRRR